jgi:hypothetical protein
MPKSRAFEIECPCCGATLKVDPDVKAVLSHKARPAPKTIEDIGEGVQRLKGAEARREEAFQKSFQAEKMQSQVLSKKFDELLKKAKEEPIGPPPKRDIDLD